MYPAKSAAPSFQATRQILYICPVFCNVVTCRESGKRLKPSEWPQPVVGYLFVSDFLANTSSFQRHLRVARLNGASPQFKTQLLRPLFSPELIRSEKGRFLLAGVELETQDGGRVVFEHQQLWLCRPLGPGPADESAYAEYRAPTPPPGPVR